MTTKAKFAKGNMKTGLVLTFSTLYGNDTFSVDGQQVKGTCGKYCTGCKGSCYVRSSYRYPSVIKGHGRNTLAMLLDMPKAFEDLAKQIERMRKPIYDVRMHASGEIISPAYFEYMCKLASRFPKHNFYVYTKAFDIVVPALLAGNVPLNLTVLISVWHEYGIKEYLQCQHLENVKAFAYCDGFIYSDHELIISCMCPAYDEHGKLDHTKTCDKCRLCIDSKAKVIGCYSH